MLVIRVEQKYPVHGFGDDRIHLIVIAGRCEHHVEEVLRVVQVVARIHEGLALGVLVTHGGECRHFRDQSMSGNAPMVGIVDI